MRAAQTSLDLGGVTADSVLLPEFERSLRRQLDPVWHTLSAGAPRRPAGVRGAD